MHRQLALLLFGLLALLHIGCSRPDHPDYTVAEWVLSTGGHVVIRTDSGTQSVESRRSLPALPFTVEAVAWEIYPGDRNPHVHDGDLERFHKLKGLVDLDLWAADITDAGAATIGQMPHLRKLQLSQTALSDQGLRHLEGLTHLQQLGLVDTKVSAQGVRQLQRKLPNCVILYLKSAPASKP